MMPDPEESSLVPDKRIGTVGKAGNKVREQWLSSEKLLG
jgi:hypothetical protein